MEWVETTGRTLEEAKDRALDQLGVDEQDAEFEIVEEPRPGLFGRMRGEARVRARVRPTRPRPKADRRRKGAGKAKDEASQPSTEVSEVVETTKEPEMDDEMDETPSPAATTDRAPTPRPERSDRSERSNRRDGGATEDEAAIAARFLEGLATAFGVAGSTEVLPDDEETEIRLHGDDLGLLIGPRGQTLNAIQDLTRLAVTQEVGERQGRLRIDIGGYREKRKEALVRFAGQVAEQVKASGTPRALEPMSPPDRKVVHDAINAIDGVTTTSEGEEPHRHVVVLPGT